MTEVPLSRDLIADRYFCGHPSVDVVPLSLWGGTRDFANGCVLPGKGKLLKGLQTRGRDMFSEQFLTKLSLHASFISVTGSSERAEQCCPCSLMGILLTPTRRRR